MALVVSEAESMPCAASMLGEAADKKQRFGRGVAVLRPAQMLGEIVSIRRRAARRLRRRSVEMDGLHDAKHLCRAQHALPLQIHWRGRIRKTPAGCWRYVGKVG
jgi:hypothetical protein